MGKILDLAKSVASEIQLASRHGHWILAVSQAADQIVEFAAGELNALAGRGLVPDGTQLDVGQNPDNSIVINDDNIQLNPTLQATIAGNSATIAGSGISPTGGFAYLTQAAWEVNSTTGNDANTGAPGNPLRTLKELAKRFAGRIVTQNTTISLAGTFNEQLVLDCTVLVGFTVSVLTEAPAQVSGGTLTAFTAYSATTNVDAKVTDVAQNWTTQLKRRIRLTSGIGTINGAITWVAKDLGAGVARVGQFVDRTSGKMVTPAGTETYVIETLTTSVIGIDVTIVGGGKFYAKDLLVTVTANTRMRITGMSRPASTFLLDGAILDGCRLLGSSTAIIIAIWNSVFQMVGCSHDTATIRTYYSGVIVFGHVGFGFLAAQDASDWTVSATSIQQGSSVLCAAAGAVVLLSLDGNFAAASIGIFDVTGGSPPIELDGFGVFAAVLANAVLFGTGNTTGSGVSVRVRSGSQFVYITKPVITGAASDASVGGTLKLWAAIPYVEPANNAMIVVRA